MTEPVDEPDHGGDDSPRPPLRLVALIVGVVLLVGGLVWLFGGEGDEPAAPRNVTDLPRVDGTLVEVEDDRLVMEPFEPLDGQEEVAFEIVDKYAANFDLAHLRSHSSVGIPTRIYYVDQDGTYLAVYKTDAPANSSRSEE